MSPAAQSDPTTGSPKKVISSCEETIAVAAQARLTESPCPELRRVTCEFRDGVLALRGRVSRYYLRQIARDLVRHVRGVVLIDNRLEVEPPPCDRQRERRWWHFPPNAMRRPR